MKRTIRTAYIATRDGYSADRVIADPQLNALFVTECRRLGLKSSIAELNRGLLNLRKSGGLSGLPRSKLTSFADEEEYRFASEIAARLLEQKYEVSVDEIICDPSLASEFDELAASIVPGFDSRRYRWGALNLRKGKRLQPEVLSRAMAGRNVRLGRAEDLNVDEVVRQQGIYVFYTSDSALYVGEAENLRQRIKKHLDHSDNKGLARWLWENGWSDVHIEIRVLPPDTTRRVRRAIETELIRSRNPVFNVQGR